LFNLSLGDALDGGEKDKMFLHCEICKQRVMLRAISKKLEQGLSLPGKKEENISDWETKATGRRNLPS